ncbi:hypothetical protein L195_g025955, partial [Trifolium pratense]
MSNSSLRHSRYPLYVVILRERSINITLKQGEDVVPRLFQVLVEWYLPGCSIIVGSSFPLFLVVALGGCGSFEFFDGAFV